MADTSKKRMMKKLAEMLIPGSGMASAVSRAASEVSGEDSSEDTLLQNIGKAAQKAGSYTVAPYMLKGAGYDKAPDIMGFPFDDDGNMTKEAIVRRRTLTRRTNSQTVTMAAAARTATGLPCLRPLGQA